MADPAEMSERHTATLARLAEAGERLAMKHAARALETDDPDVEAKATAAFHRAARSVRQCLALEARLARDARRAEREDRQDASRQASARVERRRDHVRAAVERLIWTETEDEHEAERLEAELDDLLDLDRFSEDFAIEAVDAHIARICRDLGLPPTAGGGDATPTPPVADWAAPAWRSSA